jgi:hypothetical protein
LENFGTEFASKLIEEKYEFNKFQIGKDFRAGNIFLRIHAGLGPSSSKLAGV